MIVKMQIGSIVINPILIMIDSSCTLMIDIMCTFMIDPIYQHD